MGKQLPKLSDRIRQAVLQAPVTRYRIAKETGITEGQLSHFVHGKGKLSQDTIDTLVDYVGLEVTIRKKTKKRTGR